MEEETRHCACDWPGCQYSSYLTSQDNPSSIVIMKGRLTCPKAPCYTLYSWTTPSALRAHSATPTGLDMLELPTISLGASPPSSGVSCKLPGYHDPGFAHQHARTRSPSAPQRAEPSTPVTNPSHDSDVGARQAPPTQW